VIPDFASIDGHGRAVRLEYQWLGSPRDGAPLLVFLHEGLGSLSMWRDFPARLCGAVGARGLVYSRSGYGRSTPAATGDVFRPDFLHREAHDALPALLAGLGVEAERVRPWLFGHSDGASIALLYAARFPEALSGAIVLAPHIMVEHVTVAGIERSCEAYRHGDLRARLARYHDDPDGVFWRWSRIWLDADFRPWSIEAELAAIRCPLLAVQGVDDQYGTLDQIRGIVRLAPRTELLELPACGHSPHRDQPDAVIEATSRFLRGNIAGDAR
jgi:pimeloyl-ACP methyl ester carboxylesterase